MQLKSPLQHLSGAGDLLLCLIEMNIIRKWAPALISYHPLEMEAQIIRRCFVDFIYSVYFAQDCNVFLIVSFDCLMFLGNME